MTLWRVARAGLSCVVEADTPDRAVYTAARSLRTVHDRRLHVDRLDVRPATPADVSLAEWAATATVEACRSSPTEPPGEQLSFC